MTEKLDPFDVKALEGSLNDSATRVSTLWISFLVFGLYLAIAAGTVTHRQLFLEDPVKLPVLNIDLPMVGFFFLAPILFVVFHVYVMLQVLLLGRTAATYNEAVEYNVKDPADNARVRQRLANTLFAQIFAGSPRERKGWLGLLLQMMAWLTLAIAPVLVLLVFQFQFLPYHSRFVTWTLRILVVLDLFAVLVFWPAVRNPDQDVSLRVILRRWIALLFGLLLIALSWFSLAFPGERHAEWIRPSDTIDTRCFPTSLMVALAFPLFDRLSLPQAVVIDHERLRKIEANTKSDGLPDYEGERTQSLRHRNLDCADFRLSDLRRVDLTNASLRGASLGFAQLQGATLPETHLDGASLLGVQLQGAFLASAQLQGARLDRAQLQGASLESAQLQGARLDRAQLQGASLDRAQLQGASLDGAQLQGASLDGAQLQGASLVGAELQGASFVGARLQGAVFDRSSLEHANVTEAFVWRARNASCEGARVAEINQELGLDNITDFISRSLKDVPSDSKKPAIDRMRAGLIVDPANDDTTAIANVWTQCAGASKLVSKADFEKQLGVFLRDTVCEAKESREAIAKGIINNWVSQMSERIAISTQIARAFLGADAKSCEATQNLSEKTKDSLRAFLPGPAIDERNSSPTTATQGPN